MQFNNKDIKKAPKIQIPFGWKLSIAKSLGYSKNSISRHASGKLGHTTIYEAIIVALDLEKQKRTKEAKMKVEKAYNVLHKSVIKI